MAGDSITFTSTSAMFEQLDSEPADLAVIGLVKPAEDGAESLHFSLHGRGSWVRLPATIVERYQPLVTSGHGDQRHHVVRLQLKRPEDDHGSALAELLTHHLQASSLSGISGTLAEMGTDRVGGCPPGTYWDAAKGGCVPLPE